MFLDGHVLSLFDGMSCGQIALNRLGVVPLVYYASEVDKHAITVTQANYPHTFQLGSVTEWRTWDIDWSKIKLLMGGSPCQGFSAAGKQGGTKARLNGVEIVVNSLPMYHAIKAAGGEFLSQSHLFWEYVDILEHVKKYNPDVLYLLENVKMTKNNMDMITNALNVEPVFINSALVSAQNRQRYYWCNWNVEQPEDRGIVLADILETDGTGFIKSHGEYKERSEKSQCIDANYHKGADNHGQRTLIANPAAVRGRYIVDGKRQDGKGFKVAGLTQQTLEVRNGDKSNSLTTVQKDTVVSLLPPGRYPIGARFNRKDGLGSEVDKAFSLNASDWRGLNRNQTQTAVVTGAEYRKLTPIECERLQTVPDNYTNHVSNTQRYKMLGNGWQVDTVAHILKQALTPASLASNI